MPRVETLEILGAIVDQLGPVGNIERGTPLRSSDWNIVVGAVSSLAKLVASREQTLDDQLEEGFAPLNHDHRGEATLAWFEPDTRQLLEAAASGSVDQRLGQQKIERELGAIRDDIKALRQEMEQLRLSVDQMRDNDFARERSIGRVANDVAVLRGLERNVDNLGTRITGLDDGIAAVLTFRDQLQRDGDPIDVAGLAERVEGLEGLRENLITANGELVRIREIESAIARLEEGSIRRTEVDGLVADRVRDAGILDDARLLDGIADRVQATFDPRFAAAAAESAALRGEFRALEGTVGPLDARIDAVDERLAGQDTRLKSLSTLAPRLAQQAKRLAAAEAGLAEAQAAVAGIAPLEQSVVRIGTRVDGFAATESLATANAAAIRALDTRTSGLETATKVLPELTARVVVLEERTRTVSAHDTRLDAVEARTGELATRFDVTEAEVATLGVSATRIDAVERQTVELTQWRAAADRRIAQLSTGPDRAVSERLTRLEEGLAEQRVAVAKLEQRTGTTGRPVR